MKITIDTDQIANKVKEGARKYGKQVVPAGAKVAAKVGAKVAKTISKSPALLGRDIKDKMDRDAIANRLKKTQGMGRGIVKRN